MSLSKDINNTSESFNYNFSGWWVEQNVNESADMTNLKTKKHDGWWFENHKLKVPETATSEYKPSQNVETEETPEQELSELEKYQAVLRKKFAKAYKTPEKVQENEEDSESSEDYDSGASFQVLSFSDSEEEN